MTTETKFAAHYTDTDENGTKLYTVTINGRVLYRLYTEEEVARARKGYGA